MNENEYYNFWNGYMINITIDHYIMTSMASNLDPKLLKGMDENTMNLVNEEKKSKRKERPVRERCTACVRCPTIGKAYDAMMNLKKPVKVLIHKEIKENEIKESSYIQCSKTTKDDDSLCHLHLKKLNENEESILYFQEICDKIEEDDSEWRHATEDDSYFEKMTKDRGCRHRTTKLVHKFEHKDDPIYLILNHKNGKLRTLLLRSAQEILREHLLKNGKKVSVEEDDEDDEEDEPEEIHEVVRRVETRPVVKSSKSVVSVPEKKSNTKKVLKKRSTEAVDSEEEQETFQQTVSLEPDFGSDDEDEEDGDDYERLTSKNGTPLFYFPLSKMVYKPIDEDGDTEAIGKLYEIRESDATIVKDGKYYTTLSKIHSKKFGGSYLHSELDNKVYDFYLNYQGRLVKFGKSFDIEKDN